MEQYSSFKFDSQYPVFWKRAAFYLADRPTLSAINHATGETGRFGSGTVESPDGDTAESPVSLRMAGFYTADGQREAASLLDERESDTNVEPLEDRNSVAGSLVETEQRTVPRPLSEYVALAALVVVVLEIGYLRRRGDL
jgi:hypothetical protein